MKIKLAIEWFLNPDHLPFIIAEREGYFSKHGIDFELIEPTEHYDGLDELLKGNIAFATNEPLHLIEQFDDNMLSLGTFFETKGGVLMKTSSYDKLLNGENITVTTPVSNEVTNAIGFEIIRRYYANRGVAVTRDQVTFVANGFQHIKFMKEGADAGWLYFYNFEGIEAQHEGLDVIYMDAQNSGFANFSALDIFTTKTFYRDNHVMVGAFVNAVKEAIAFIHANPNQAMAHYYAYINDSGSPLMDDIIKATMPCFNEHFESVADASTPILEFFREIGITNLDSSRFKTAFLA
jgi:putative hydroxymethylpyrimidine transport system substrate-binding protein